MTQEHDPEALTQMTLTTSLPSSHKLKRLLQQQAAFKRSLTAFAVEEGPRELEDIVDSLHELGDSEITAIIATEMLLFEDDTYGPYWVLDAYLELVMGVTPLDREFVEHFKRDVYGHFLMGPHHRAGDLFVMDAFNLTDMMPYTFASNAPMNSQLLSSFDPGRFVFMRLVPLPGTGLHVLSGPHVSRAPSEAEEVFSDAVGVASAMPRYHLRNPLFLERALEIQTKQHEAFVAQTGSAFFVGESSELTTMYRLILADQDEAPEFNEGSVLQGEVAAFSDPREGIAINPGLVSFVRALRGETGATFRSALVALNEMEEDFALSPTIFEAAAREYPETFAQMITEASIPGAGKTLDDFLEHIRGVRAWYDPEVGGVPKVYTGGEELYRQRRDAWLKALAERGPLQFGDPNARQRRRKAAKKLKKKRR